MWRTSELYKLARLYTHKGLLQHWELHALLFSNSVWGSLPSHIELTNMEGIVRPGLRFIVLIRDLKV